MAKRYNRAEKVVNRLFAKDSLVSDEVLEDKMRAFSKFSLSYFMLLTASVIIATLGLLMNAPAIVIGSMIISPLTWPMFGLADGAALGNRKRIKANMYILLSSVAYGILLAYVLTIFSPLKVVNNEILSRSVPTLLDAVVALTAGAIGILALVRKNISDTVAGVAVALSLTPPLCVLGISLALGENDIVKGSFLLLLTNALSITLIAGLILVLVHYSWRRKLRMAPRAFIIMVISLVLTAIPLYRLLSVYSLESSSYAVVQSELESYVLRISPSGEVQNISTNLEEKEGADTLVVTADVFLPPTASITFKDKDELTENLTTRLNRVVDLRLRVQTVSLLTTLEDIEKTDTQRQIQSLFTNSLKEINQALNIDDLEVIQDANDNWQVTAKLTGAQGSEPTEQEIALLQEALNTALSLDIDINVSFIPVTAIKSQRQTVIESLRADLQTSLLAAAPDAQIAALNVGDDKEGQDIIIVDIEIKLPETQEISEELAQALKNTAAAKLDSQVLLKIRVLTFNETSY